MNNQTKNTDTLELNQLKSHRENQQLSVQAVADSMKVSRDLIARIESGEFDKLGAPTFVRGHISNYCKVVGLEPSSILAQIPVQYLTHQELQTSNAMGGSPLSHVRRQSNHLGRYAIGTGLLGMLCMSFYFVWDKWSQPNVSQIQQDIIISQGDEEVDGKKKITYSSLIPQVTGPNLNSEQPVNALSDNDSAIGVPTLTTDEDISTDSDIDAAETPDEDTEGEQETDQLMASDTETTTDNSAVTDRSELMTSKYAIVMEFEEQAWVSIKTLDGELVIQDLLGPGLKEIEVDEPVHFRIGNATKMQLSINDDSVELAPLTRQDIADFNWPLEPSS